MDNSTEAMRSEAGDLINLSQEIFSYSSSNMPIKLSDEMRKSAADLSLLVVGKSLELEGNLSDAWEQKGFLLYSMKRYKESIQCFDCVLDEDPMQQEIWMKKGNAMMEINDYDGAINCFRMAISCCQVSEKMKVPGSNINELKANAWLKMGNCYYNKADISYLNENDDNGKTYDKGADEDKAISCYMEAINAFSNSNSPQTNSLLLLDAWMGLGNTYMAIGRYDKAIFYYNLIIPKFNASIYGPYIFDAWLNQGIAELKKADTLGGEKKDKALHRAEICFAKSAEISESDWRSHFGQWIALHSLSKEQEADAAFNKAVALKGGTRLPSLMNPLDFIRNISARLAEVLRYVS
jgi:tetratricopeptide (TPR) repeat protein